MRDTITIQHPRITEQFNSADIHSTPLYTEFHIYLHMSLYVHVLLGHFLVSSAVSAADWGKTRRLG